MRNTLLIVFFLPLFWVCNTGKDTSRLNPQYLHYVSYNGTSPLLLQNVNPVVNKTWALTQDKSVRGPELISSYLQSVMPPFVIVDGNEKCNQDSQKFLKHLNRMDLWALKMYDASGKLPSGLLNGNVNQFGDFDECLSVEEPELGIKGKYCLAYLQVRPVKRNVRDEVFQAFKLMQSHFIFKSKLTDPGHRIPRFSTLNWGLCVPSTCTAEDVESRLREVIERHANGTGFDVEVKIDNEMCQENKPFRVSVSFGIVSFVFFLIVVAAVLGTLKDALAPKENSSEVCFWSVLNCFSLKRNIKSLLSLTRPPDDIESVHGIRMINALMLVLSHKSMALFFIPYSNRTSMVEKLSQPWCIIARIASLYTDSFIMISGLLSSYSFVKTLKKTGKLDFKNEYMSRLIRIIPPLAAIILLSTFILPELGSGPQWNLTVSHHADKCQKTWWKNFLFIHNYWGFENMCLTHTHHLGIDTQLFFISPFLVLLIFKWPIYGLSFLFALATISTVVRYQVTAEKNLSFFIYSGISVSQMFDTANYSYILPFHRLTVYIMGILFGYALRHCGKDCKMKSNLVRIGWTVTFSFLSYVLTKASEMNHFNYVYDNHEAAMYAALAPIAWCLFLGWTIFVCYIGYGGFLGRILSSKYWLVWTRLSYAVYLTQFPVFFFNVGLQKYSQQYSIFLLMNILEYGCVLIASAALTLFFDMPFANMKKLLIKK